MYSYNRELQAELDLLAQQRDAEQADQTSRLTEKLRNDKTTSTSKAEYLTCCITFDEFVH